MVTKAYFSVAALLLAGCGADSGRNDDADAGTPVVKQAPVPNVSDASDATTVPTGAAGYIAVAGAGDLWEIESSRALAAKSTNADVKKFAAMMIDHHTKSTEKIKAAAKAGGITVGSPTFSAEQQSALNEIKTAQPADIDAVYLRHQRAAHLRARALHEGYADAGDNAALKKAAAEIFPVVVQHIAEIDRLGRSIPGSAG